MKRNFGGAAGALMLVTAFVLSGCMNPTASSTSSIPNVSSSDVQRLQTDFMSSYYASTGGGPQGARALTPFYPHPAQTSG
ncbi:MAG: hypothetical protein HKM06_07535, partial [Spirochaetales bacterium]|nr:hypothetical protein [Spirochaetales bacterium]